MAGLSKGGEALMVYHLVFETAPEAFNEGIVAAVAWAAHGRDQPMLGEKLPYAALANWLPRSEWRMSLVRDAGRICHPNLIWTMHGEALETVGSDRSTVPTVGRVHAIFGALPGEEPLRPHESGDAVAPPGTA
jgi:hypothetical protein